MPHICTRCNSVFESGEDILKGCPSCGWKKFMFVRKLPREVDMPAVPEGGLITSAMGVRKPPPKAKITLGMARDGQSIREDFSQTQLSAKKQSTGNMSPEGSVAQIDHSPDHQEAARQDPAPSIESGWAGGEKALESVKITAPGTYELNLPSLFERDELIMAVKEGTYFIDLTSAFKKSKKD